MPPRGRGRGRSGSRAGGERSGSGPSDSKPSGGLRRIMRERRPSPVKGISGSDSKANEGASRSVTRSVSSSSLSTEVSDDSGYTSSFTSAFEEEFGSRYDSDSDGQKGDVELDEFDTIAATLPYNGITMLLFETPSGFALFTFSAVFCHLPDSVDNIWAEFGDPLRAPMMVYPKGFETFEDKSRAINADTGVDNQLADLINTWHKPGMNLCVGKPEYKEIIESKLKIPCRMYCQTVMEIVWGIQQQMSLFVPWEKSKLTKEDRLPMSQGLKKFLSNYGYDVKPEMVNEKIFKTACSLFQYNVDDKSNLATLRNAGFNIRNISGIACEDWDILKLAIAAKVICCPEEELTDFHGVLAEDVVSKLKGDAPKYKGIPIQICWLRASKAAVSNHHQRIVKENLLRSLVKEAKEAYEVKCTQSLNRRRSPRLNRMQKKNTGEGSCHKRPKYLGTRGTPTAVDY